MTSIYTILNTIFTVYKINQAKDIGSCRFEVLYA